MYTVQIGSFILNGQLLLMLAFGGMGWVALRAYARRRLLQDDCDSIAINAFMIWLMVWKGSILLFDPVTTIQHPLTLLYYDGGIKGRWIATVITGLYLVYKTRRDKKSWQVMAETTTVYLLGGIAAYHIGLLWFESDLGLFHIANAILAMFVLGSFLLVKELSWTSVLVRWLWICLGMSVIPFMNSERMVYILSFSMQQVICIVIGLGILIVMSKLERKGI